VTRFVGFEDPRNLSDRMNAVTTNRECVHYQPYKNNPGSSAQEERAGSWAVDQ
jgi:hypothetical protein